MMMINQKAATKEQAEARTWVIWDINSCPVPDECDASWVGPCIKRTLKNLGYLGPVTITAMGTLTDVPDKFLQSVSSTGIVLWHTHCSIASAMTLSAEEFPSTTNILLISARSFVYSLQFLEREGYNILPQVFFKEPQKTVTTSTRVESLWKRFLKEEKCSETSECEWVCRVCSDRYCVNFTVGQGFEDFINHILSPGHHKRMLESLSPINHKFYKKKAKAYHDSHLKNNATTSVNKEPKPSFNI